MEIILLLVQLALCFYLAYTLGWLKATRDQGRKFRDYIQGLKNKEEPRGIEVMQAWLDSYGHESTAPWSVKLMGKTYDYFHKKPKKETPPNGTA